MTITDLSALLPPSSRVLCAVSGGADSMCMLHRLKALEKELAISVCAAHFEHGIRGEESVRDCRFVQEYCQAQDIPFICEHGDVPAEAERRGLGLEETARLLRYDFLRRAAEALGCDLIATAHNADDNAETLLLNLVRGAGSQGLCGIPPRRGNIVRPLLDMTREEIEQYNALHAVPHVEDSTNASDEYSRNLLRHKVMPVLRELNPEFSRRALSAAALLRRDGEYLDAQAEEFIREHFDGQSVGIAALKELDRAVSSRVIRRLWSATLYEKHMEAVYALTEGSGLGFADLPGGRMRREQGRLYFTAPETAQIEEMPVRAGETLLLPRAGLKISAKFDTFPGEIHTPFKTYCLKNEKLCGTLRCTSRRPGDRFSPAGRGCTKTLKALFTDAGMTQRERDLTPVFRDDNGIAAVMGFGIDSRFAAKPGDTVLRLDIEKL